MQKLLDNNSILTRYKKLFCVKISTVILNFYENFRECSGLKLETEKKLNDYKRSESDNKIVKQALPQIKTGIVDLQKQNEFLQSRLNIALYDMCLINNFYNKNEISEIGIILNRYDFKNKIN